MALIPIPNQPVSFNAKETLPDYNCDCIGQTYCLPVQTDDVTKFQIKMGACGADVIINGNFDATLADWITNSSWVWSDGGAAHILGQTGILQQLLAGSDSTGYWEINYDVRGGSQGRVRARLEDNAVITDVGEWRNSNGSFSDVLHDNIAPPPFLFLQFEASSDFDGTIDNVTAKFLFNDTVVDVRVLIKDAKGNIVGELDNATTRVIDRGYMIYTIDWDQVDLSPGCYSLCILDPCLNTNNQFDTNLVNNELFSTTQVGSVVEITNNGALSIAIQSCLDEDAAEGDVSAPILVPGIKYQVAFTLAFNCDNIRVRPFTGTNNEDFITTDGSYSFIMEATGNEDFGFHFDSVSGEDGGCVDITAITITVDPSSYVCDLMSNCFILRDKHECSMLFRWWNDEDAFGFIYPSMFEFNMRLTGKFWKPNFAKDRKQFLFANGRRKLLLAENEEKFKITLDEAPQYVHEAMALALDHDNFIIGGDSYIGDDTDYSPEWRNSSLLAPVTFDVTQNHDPGLRNSPCN